MTDHEIMLRAIRPLRSQLEEIAQVAQATSNPRENLRMAQRLINAALDADFAAIGRLARRAIDGSHAAAGSR
jgi:hypothetical protein